jgi:hypothetical protein
MSAGIAEMDGLGLADIHFSLSLMEELKREDFNSTWIKFTIERYVEKKDPEESEDEDENVNVGDIQAY